jgi:hypothetical protein
MAWSSATLSASLLSLMAADKPIILGNNRIYQYHSDSRWNTTGSLATADASDATTQRTWLRDGFTHLRSAPATSQTTWYLCFDLGATRTFDSCAILGHNLGTIGGVQVDLQVADNSTFGTNLQTIETWTPLTSNKRLVSVDISHSGSARQYTAQYVRLKFSKGSGIIPNIGEVILSDRRQLKHQPDYPWARQDWKSYADEFKSSNQITTRYFQASGQRRIAARLTTGASAYWDDLDNFFSLDSEYGKRPFLWIDRPTTDPQGAPLMLFADPEYSNPYNGPNERTLDLIAYEQGSQYVSAES